MERALWAYPLSLLALACLARPSSANVNGVQVCHVEVICTCTPTGEGCEKECTAELVCASFGGESGSDRNIAAGLQLVSPSDPRYNTYISHAHIPAKASAYPKRVYLKRRKK